MRWDGPDGYWVSDDPALLDVTRVHGWMSAESYWAQGREYQVMATAIEHSLVFGLYAADGTQAGFARMVTDRATFAWLCDVFVATEHRAHRLGSFLVEAATSHPDVGSIRQVLMAAPERGLYRRLGFAGLRSPERWLERRGEGPG
ncbi:MAG TPA: GNAT family N-acetyltransferase [Streptosporangiaceae bacterium]|jgi:GNAT superfamily N-acetyltransferase|nr:GNAT family N-acetyltransferase [Streptosporangiaceae bacterium]